MKDFTKGKIGFLILILIAASSLAHGQVTYPKPIIDTVEVVGVRDGDTIDVLYNGVKTGVRFSGIDTPEVDHKHPEKSQPYGLKAQEFLVKQVSGKTIVVTLYGEDQYKRLLGDIYLLGTRTWVNLSLVQNGLAWHFKKYSKDTTLAQAEAKARAYKDGLWADLGTSSPPIEPWNYRKLKKQTP